MQRNKTKTLVTCAMLIAVATVLSVWPKFDGMWPNGGSVTFCSMLPIIIISYLYGMKWGFMSSTVFGVIQLMTELKGVAGASVFDTFMIILLDYIVAFAVLGIGGIFRGKFNSIAKELSLGAVVAILARFAAHFVSGYLLFSGWAEWFFTQEGFTLGNSIFAALGNGTPLYMLYSLMYNGSYLIPEMIITAVVAYILGKQKFFEKLVGETK